MKVFILATCRKAELLPAATLVFDSLRTGFPNAEVIVFDNGNSDDHKAAIREKVKEVGGTWVRMPERVIHHQWIEGITEKMMDERQEPFYFLDTDVVFWENFEQWGFDKKIPLAGRYIPRFADDFTLCDTVERLHTSLLWVNPDAVRKQLIEFKRRFPVSDFNPLANLYYPLHVPPDTFYDTCSMLYQAVGGQPFTRTQLNCYDHLFCGTISDIVGPHLNDGGMQARHQDYFKDPTSMRGIWKKQDEYYRAKAKCLC